MLREGVEEATFDNMFSGIKGIAVLDTCGNVEKFLEEMMKSGMKIPVIEKRQIGLEKLRQVVFDAIERASRAT